MDRHTIISPFGPLTLLAQEGRITRLGWGGDTDETDPPAPVLLDAARQLQAYFAGDRREPFDLPFAFLPGLTGAVQRAMCAIPMGETRTYGELAKALDAPAQAIGQACGANPIPILVPCHRILSATGLGGYSAPGGIETKVALLRHEGAASLLI
jgi:methylated-DNA-[protein]-cysteine S-methyltransferase